MRRILFVLLCVMMLPLSVGAQDKKHTLLNKADSLLTHIFKAKGDTNYVVRPDKKLTLRLLNNVSGTNFSFKSNETGNVEDRYKFLFKDPLRYTITLSANYRGLAVALAFNPANIFGKHTSTEFNINSYGNKFGFDVIYENNGQFEASMTDSDGTFDLGEVDISEKSLTINGYYAFNYKRFSYPAAFSQSYIQKKSAGSVMIGASYHRSTLKINSEAEPDPEYDDLQKIKTSYAGIGVGYGYNFVPTRNWLIHLSALPTLVVWNENKVVLTTRVDKLQSKFPEYSIVGRASVVRYFKSFFTGLTLVYNYTSVGDRDIIRLSHNKWRTRFILGMRF